MTKPTVTEPTVTEPAGALAAVVLNLLAPLLLAGANNDPALARLAAQQAIEAYQAVHSAQLISVAQVVAYAVAGLDALRLSMDPALSPSMTLKHRGNANALGRSSQRAADALARQRRDHPGPRPDAPPADTPPMDTPPMDTPCQIETLAALEAARAQVQAAPAAEPPPEQRRRAWAAAMTTVAAEYAAELDTLPLAQRRASLIRIGALTDSARALSRPPASPRAALLNTTTLTRPPETQRQKSVKSV